MATITINLRSEEEQRLRALKEEEGLPMSYFLRKGLKLYFKELEEQNAKK